MMGKAFRCIQVRRGVGVNGEAGASGTMSVCVSLRAELVNNSVARLDHLSFDHILTSLNNF